jgi:hypothetical protein
VQQRRGDVFGLHAMHGAGRGVADDLVGQARDGEQQVDGVDRLGEQHATTVARRGAAPGLIVVGLGAPVVDASGGGNEPAEPAVAHEIEQRAARGTVAVLEDDAEGDTALPAGGDNGFRALEADVERLFQNDVLADVGGGLNQLEMGVWRRQDEHDVDRGVGKDRLGAVSHRHAVTLRESSTAGRRRAVGGGDFDAVAKGV